MDFIDNFHFLRPLWFLGLLLLIFLPFFLRLYGKNISSWNTVCDKHLLEVLLTHQDERKSKLSILALVLAYFLSILALSGPTWERTPSYGATGGKNTVFVLDMGVDMGASDINPTRLERSKYKLYDLLEKIKGDSAGLVLFDNEGYMVSPLSEDLTVLSNIIPTLDLSVMPGNGASVIEKGIREAVNLLDSSKAGRGRIIVLTGAGSSSAINAKSEVKRAADKGHIVSILAVGTEGGAPAPNPSGNFYTDGEGRTILFKTGMKELSELAFYGNGVFTEIRSDDIDLERILSKSFGLDEEIRTNEIKVDEWKDMGVYLLLVIVPLFLFAFRRGFIAVILLCIMNPLSSEAGVWEDLWLNSDQQGIDFLDQGDYKQAGSKFKDSRWKGYALYKGGDYKGSIKHLSGLKDVTSLYNLGNAKAYDGDISGAISSYEEVLKIDPDHEDARYNLEYLKREQEKQEQEEQQQEQAQQEQIKQQKNPNSENEDREEENTHEEERGDAKEGEESFYGSKEGSEEEGKNKTEQERGSRGEEALSQEGLEEEQSSLGGLEGKEDKFLSEEEQSDIQMLNRVQEDKGGLLRSRLKKIYEERRGR